MTVQLRETSLAAQLTELRQETLQLESTVLEHRERERALT